MKRTPVLLSVSASLLIAGLAADVGVVAKIRKQFLPKVEAPKKP